MAQSKKKRTSGMFDFDNNMLSKFEEEKRNLNTVRERLKAVNEVDLVRLMSDACVLMEDEALQLLAAKLSIEGLLNLRNVSCLRRSRVCLHSIWGLKICRWRTSRRM
jgi:hypothetical protein